VEVRLGLVFSAIYRWIVVVIVVHERVVRRHFYPVSNCITCDMTTRDFDNAFIF
jgi:hypothetical protein